MRSLVVILFLALLALFVFVKEIPAQVYKYVDKDGRFALRMSLLLIKIKN